MADMLGEVSGSVRKWDDEKGWGFISGYDGGDYFVNYKMIVDGEGRGLAQGMQLGLQQGAMVQFTPSADNMGGRKMQANNVNGPGVVPRGMHGMPPKNDGGPPDGALSGTVAKWVEEKGIGYITGPDGKDYFVHHSAFGGGRLKEGALAHFCLSEDHMHVGKMKAVNVSGPAVQSKWDGPWCAGTASLAFGRPSYPRIGGRPGGSPAIMGPGGGGGVVGGPAALMGPPSIMGPGGGGGGGGGAGELRVDPADGRAYSRGEFMAAYGGTAEWAAAQAAELRVDEADGRAYTLGEFLDQYGADGGGEARWSAAPPAPPPPAPRPPPGGGFGMGGGGRGGTRGYQVGGDGVVQLSAANTVSMGKGGMGGGGPYGGGFGAGGPRVDSDGTVQLTTANIISGRGGKGGPQVDSDGTVQLTTANIMPGRGGKGGQQFGSDGVVQLTTANLTDNMVPNIVPMMAPKQPWSPFMTAGGQRPVATPLPGARRAPDAD